MDEINQLLGENELIVDDAEVHEGISDVDVPIHDIDVIVKESSGYTLRDLDHSIRVDPETVGFALETMVGAAAAEGFELERSTSEMLDERHSFEDASATAVSGVRKSAAVGKEAFDDEADERLSFSLRCRRERSVASAYISYSS